MTETVIEPQAPPEETTPAPSQQAESNPSAARKEVEHTPGGFPVVPLAFSGVNSAAGLVATAALAGGPAGAAIAMTGAAALAAVAARQHAKTTKPSKDKPSSKASPREPRSAGQTGAGRRGGGLLGRVPSQPGAASRTGRVTGSSARSGTAPAGGQARHRAGAPAAGKAGASRSVNSKAPAGKGTSSAQGRTGRALGGLAGGRAGQVRDLRAQARTDSPTRAAQRAASTQARRQVADSRRAARAADRAASTPAKPKGAAARTLAKGMSKAVAVRDKAVQASRKALDRSAGRTIEAGRDAVREAAVRKRAAQLKAPAQKAARKALMRSAARFHARRALGAVIGGAAGLLGMVTTPLGRKLGWSWLMNPGRRLYSFLVGRARAVREARDEEIRAQLEADEEAADERAAAEQEAAEPIGDRVERPTTHVPAPPTPEGAQQMSNVSGFRFEELAAEMEQAAQSYEPENCMEILAMLEGLPEALQAIANILRILAERSDSEFPFEKVVADMLGDLFQMFTNTVDYTEQLGPVFREAHEADIARHEDPRNGYDAEKGWNV
ncbi:hypothetical protein [Streptomyces sp. NPDC001594]|uniref:hypothetical protein n=1 Tax=Streptomyces sp. NPDC001594 TaxID=3364590 RepID=UPI00368B4998